MIKENTFLQIIIITAMIFLLNFILIIEVQAQEAVDFYKDSNLELYHEDGNFYLSVNTPLSVLCAVNFAEIEEDYNNITAMDMVAPAKKHEVELGLKPNHTYKIMLTAFTDANEIYRSQEYLIDTNIENKNGNLIVSTENKARVIDLEAADQEFKQVPIITEVAEARARIEFSTANPTLSSTAFGETEELGRIVRAPGSNPAKNHEVSLPGLQSDSKYYMETITIDDKGELLRSSPDTFTTTAATEKNDYGKNYATLQTNAEISAVSSNFGNDISGSFGARNTIDGDAGTEWSSQGEGDDAWIEIKLAERIKVTGFGFWSRTMGETGEIRRLRIVTGDGDILGEFDIPDADRLYNFSLSPTQTQSLRFEVVNSTGGNTGARKINIYGNK